MTRVLLLGGTGFVGRHVCEHLVRQGCSLTVPTRRTKHAAPIQHLPGLTILEADVHDDSVLRGMLAGQDAVVNLVAMLHGRESDFERAHVALPTRLAHACLTTGVPRLVHISALGAQAVATDSLPSRYLRSRSRGEAALQASNARGLQLTVLRPSVIFGADDRLLNLFARLQRTFPVLPLAAAQARFQPVWVEDVALAVERCLQDGRSIGQTYELCGPTVMTLRDLVQLAGRAAGVSRPVLPLPAALGRLQAALMELAPGEPLMSRDNLDSMKIDNVATGQLPGLQALGITPTGPAAVAPGYLGSGDGMLALRERYLRR